MPKLSLRSDNCLIAVVRAAALGGIFCIRQLLATAISARSGRFSTVSDMLQSDLLGLFGKNAPPRKYPLNIAAEYSDIFQGVFPGIFSDFLPQSRLRTIIVGDFVLESGFFRNRIEGSSWLFFGH